MSTFKIRVNDDPILRRKCKPVERVDQKVRDIFDRMLETMYAAPGVGLAAPQVGISRRLIVIDVGDGPIKLANPKVTFLSDEEELGVEGCLSYPGLEGEVWRCSKVRLSGLDENGQRVSYEGEGLFARCAQHECDHLDGRVYIDIAENVRPVTAESQAESEEEGEEGDIAQGEAGEAENKQPAAEEVGLEAKVEAKTEAVATGQTEA